MLSKMASASSPKQAPLYIGTSAAYSASSAPVVTAVAGVQAGDLLIAWVNMLSLSNYLSSVPSGWTSVANNYGFASGPAFALLVKVATASEPANYTFTANSGGDRVHATIFAYRNATKVNTVGSLARSSGVANSSASSITPTYGGELLALFGANTLLSVTTPPSGMTLIATNANTQNSVSSYRVSGSGTSATGGKTLTWSGTCNNYGVLIQVTNESDVTPSFIELSSTQNAAAGSSLVINKPSGTVEGDLMLAVMANNATVADTWTGDTDWTEIVDQNLAPNLRIAYKVATASEGASYTFTATINTQILAGSILTYRSAAYNTVSTLTTGTSNVTYNITDCTFSQSLIVFIAVRTAASVTITGNPLLNNRVSDTDVTGPSYLIADRLAPNNSPGTTTLALNNGLNAVTAYVLIKPSQGLT